MISGALYHLVATYPVISFSVGLAKPKSKIFSSQSSFTAMLDGFKSCKKDKHSVRKSNKEKKERYSSISTLYELMMDRKMGREYARVTYLIHVGIP